MDLVNEEKLGASIANNLEPKIKAAQDRLQNWASAVVDKLVDGYTLKVGIPFGDRTVEVTVALVPRQ